MATILLPERSERERVLERVRSAGYQPAELEEGILIRDPSGNPIPVDGRGPRRSMADRVP
jgi:hypothetical protein